MLLSNCAVCSKKKSSFMKSQEATRLELHQIVFNKYIFSIKFKIISLKQTKLLINFCWLQNKFISEMHLRQPGFTCSACRPSTKHRERIKKFRETGGLKHIYKNESDKACFAHDAAYSDSKDLSKNYFR